MLVPIWGRVLVPHEGVLHAGTVHAWLFEGALAGGFGAAVLESLNDHDITPSMLRIGIPDQLVDHATPQQSKESLGLTPAQMTNRIMDRFPLSSRADFIETSRVGAVQS